MPQSGAGRIKAARRLRAAHSPHGRRARHTNDPTSEGHVTGARGLLPARGGARLQDLPVPEGHEADAREEATSAHQPLLGRAQGPNGHRTAGGRGERLETGEGGHPRADGTAPAQPEAKGTAGVEARVVLRRTFQSRIHAMRHGGVAVYCERDACRERDAEAGPCRPSSWGQAAATPHQLHSKAGDPHGGAAATDCPDRHQTHTVATGRASADHPEAGGRERREEARGGACGAGGEREEAVRAALAAPQPRLRDRPRPVDVEALVNLDLPPFGDCVTERVIFKRYVV